MHSSAESSSEPDESTITGVFFEKDIFLLILFCFCFCGFAYNFFSSKFAMAYLYFCSLVCPGQVLDPLFGFILIDVVHSYRNWIERYQKLLLINYLNKMFEINIDRVFRVD